MAPFLSVAVPCIMCSMRMTFIHLPWWAHVLMLIAIGCTVFYVALVILFRPSHDRVWELGQEALPYIRMEGDAVTITNFRNFDWQGEGKAVVRYETRTFSLSALERVDVFISHFDDFEGLAHIFLSFGFSGGEQAVVSFETRRKDGQKFSPFWGLFRQFEIIYVVGSEEDIVGLRTGVRNERVYLYPTKASPAHARELFTLVAKDINTVFEKPRKYNTLTNNCTNALTRRVEEMSDVRFPYTWKTLFPGYFDEVLYDLGVIANDADFSLIKEQHYVDNATVDRYNTTFSRDLRAGLGVRSETHGATKIP